MTVFDTGSFQAENILHGRANAVRAATAIRKKLGSAYREPVCAIVLGSGLGGLADQVDDATRIVFAEIPGFPSATVAGHAGELIAGNLAGQPVIALAGRLHMYEGHEPSLSAFPVRVLHALGARTYLASNAAGGVRRTLKAGDLMVVADHLNLMFRNPLTGPVETGDQRFPDMSNPYDPELRALLHACGKDNGELLKDGVYCGLIGPTYETPAEVRMLERFGVDAVGMSTVPEVIVARALGMRVAAVSCITNQAAGISLTPLQHAEVLGVGRAVAIKFETLISEFVRRLGRLANESRSDETARHETHESGTAI
jgi:purine-nucleoside phosphorylase